ncbi:hypothetical protein D3C71_1328310 [compost metagenome]
MGVGLLQRGQVLFAGLMNNHRATILRQAGQRLRNHRIQCLRAQAATHDKQAQRTGTAGVANGRIGQRAQVGTHGITQRFALGQHARKAAEHAARHLGQALVRGAGHGILFVHHQRRAAQGRDHAPREGHVAAHAQHHVRTHIRQTRPRLCERAQQQERQFQQRGHSLAAHALEAQRHQFDTARRHKLAFHLVRVAQPQHAPAALAQHVSHGQARHDVPAGAAGHDQDGAGRGHTRPPRIITRFSTSTRISMASAHRFITTPDPP